MNQLAIPLVNVTQQAALAVYPYIGKEDKNKADFYATEAMRRTLNNMKGQGTVVIGEGEMDEAPMLFIGEKVGKEKSPELDIAVDPIDGTKLVASGKEDAIAVLALAEKGTLLHAPDMYMEKIAVGPKAKGVIDLKLSPQENVRNVAKAMKKPLSETEVVIQDRPRHQKIIEQIRATGAKVSLFQEVDINAAVSTALSSHSADMFIGKGGAPEGVIAAVALRSMGGDFQGKLCVSDQNQYKRCRAMGITDPEAHLKLEDIVSSDNCLFAATGITDGRLLNGVREENNFLVTHSFLALEKQLYVINSQHEMDSSLQL
ncbi:class II fructose-bisphosphatase [Marinococcus sp. PL1-022]|uniref:class II fructose-bisphosphatase n=1 Tax=Marinococcus sp. PL1-022 TaxID=3095363 RepID=UPI0029C1BA7C|nr:class II fructose-bisphosphatase [Marinococcus sp. PL1-022]MDX6154020.1 class II fructose-bisphosphatase [Marinococcus sp. PL1-022]